MGNPRRVQFVLKVSKLCNLRCRYCYELEELGNRKRMSLEDLQALYENIAPWYAEQDPSTVLEFVWHGGEPLLVPPDFYWRTFEAQERAFAGRTAALRNVVQTNLTVLDDDRVALLRDGFDGVGVSLDLFGGLRVDAGGRDSVRKVLANVERLRVEKVRFGCITVLTRANLPWLRKIVRFHDELGVESLRILPLFDGPLEAQHAGYEITREEVLSGLQAAFEELIARDSALRVEPIDRHINQAMHHHTPGATPCLYDKRSWEPVYIVDTNGDLYGYADGYVPEFRHGNLFRTPLRDTIGAPGHLRAIEAAERRVNAVCAGCRFHGSCDGYPMAEEAAHQRKYLGDALDCVVDRGMLRYVERRLMELGAIHPVTGIARMPAPRRALGVIDQLPLQEGVHVRFRHPEAGDPGDRLRLSRGTTSKLPEPGDGLSYLRAALVPAEPWRRPTDGELRLLLGTGAPADWSVGSDVGVVRIPDQVIVPLERIFEDFGTRERLDEDRYQVHTNHPGWEAAYRGLIAHLLEEYALREFEPMTVRLATAPPAMKTVTKDTVNDRDRHYYVGMHLDTWEKVPVAERHRARNRICINLGREDRHFLFVNLTLASMLEALRAGGSPAREDYYGTDLGHDFMRAFPGYPVVKLTLRPREAYIAPTENVIHDATSVGKRYPDIALHIIGYFGFAPARAARAALSPEPGGALGGRRQVGEAASP
jgi:uncharacterized protein